MARWISAVTKKLSGPFLELHYIFTYILPPIFLSRLHGRTIRRIKGASKLKSKKSIVAVTPFYGNNALLPSFLAYYRRLGIDDFVFLDLSRDRALGKILADDADCIVWCPKGKTQALNGIHWLNFLRHRYGLDHWCLSLDPSDFLVFPHSETRSLRDLTEFLTSEGRRHIYALVLETYGDRPAEAIDRASSDTPRDLLPYFDPVGYSRVARGRLRSEITTGGLQRRTLFADTPGLSPALNRTPLVRWRWFYNYVASTRLMVPGILNTPHSRWHLTPTACLVRYALLDDGAALAIAERVERTVIVADKAATSCYPGLAGLRDKLLKHSSSAKFIDSQDLMAWGLMNSGQWF